MQGLTSAAIPREKHESEVDKLKAENARLAKEIEVMRVTIQDGIDAYEIEAPILAKGILESVLEDANVVFQVRRAEILEEISEAAVSAYIAYVKSDYMAAIAGEMKELGEKLAALVELAKGTVSDGSK